jgi:Ca2+-binding RTX toxin-like protein
MSTPTAWGTEFLVNTNTFGGKVSPTITSLANGRFVVAWSDAFESGISGHAVRAQVFNADGSKAGVEFLVNTTITGNQWEPTITTLAGRRFLVAWNDDSQSSRDPYYTAVRAQVFNDDGSKAGAEILVNTPTTLSQYDPTTTALANGRFAVAWSGSDTNGSGVRAQMFNVDGSKAGAEFLVNTTTIYDQSEPKITTLSDGRFVVVWTNESSGADTSYLAVQAQVFKSDGSKIGAEFLVNTTFYNWQWQPTITALADGRFVIAWTDESRSGGDPSGRAVRAQIFNSNGSKASAELLVNTTITDNQWEPTITALSDGRFVVAWRDNSESSVSKTSSVRAQVFNVDGTRTGAEFLVKSNAGPYYDLEPKITSTALADGRFVVAWSDNSQSGGDSYGFSVRAQIFDPRTAAVNLVGSVAGDDLVGTIFNDTIKGSLGNDRLRGGAGDDRLYGGGDNDTLMGEVGNDLLDGGTGNDRLIGNGGNDTLIGGIGKDSLSAGAGNDILIGGAEADQLSGAAGADTFRYQNLNDSLLPTARRDWIRDLAIGTDIIDGPNTMSAAALVEAGAATRLTAGAISGVLTPGTFVANGAASFTVGTRTYLALNDASAGFQAANDSVINITGFTGSLTDLVIV